MSPARSEPRRSGRPPASAAGQMATEDAFIAAATKLFAQKGYKDTSINDLARELGLTPASMYHYVDGKQDLLARVLETGMAGFLSRLEGIVDGTSSPRTKVAMAIQNHIDFVLNNRDVVSIFFRYRQHLAPKNREHYEQVLETYESLFSGLLQTAMDAGELIVEDPVLLRLYVLGMINAATQWYRPDGRLTIGDIRSHMSHIIMDRLLASP